ncbi:MAG: tetratricopeptide repeat protein, partial [Syntrophales bacterium]
LKIMRRYEFYSNSVPSYFLTHPGTDERIAYLDGLLQTVYTQRGKESIIGKFKRIQTILLIGDKNLNANLKHFQNELEKNPNSVDDLYGLAAIQEKLGLIPESLKNFHQALKISPDDEDILRDLGITYFKIGRTAEAVSFLKQALNINDADVNTLLYLGRSYEAQEDYATALSLYRKLEEKNIDDTDIYYNIAMAYGKTNNPGASHFNFGIYFKKKNKRESALFHFKEALKYFPGDSQKAKDIKEEMESLKEPNGFRPPPKGSPPPKG